MSLAWPNKKKIISFLLDTNFDESPARVAHKAATLFEVVFESEDSLKKLKQELKKEKIAIDCNACNNQGEIAIGPEDLDLDITPERIQ
jgi:hypothetical protein